MTPFVLIRHAATAWNQEGLIQGQSDPPLSPEGRRQVGRCSVSKRPNRNRPWRK